MPAPINGRVGLRLVDAGNIVHANDPNGVVGDYAIAAYHGRVRPGGGPSAGCLRAAQGREQLVVEAFDREQKRKLATGTLLTVDNQIDPTTGTVRLKAVFPNDDSSLFPNQFVNARLLLDIKRV
ncbi:MAG: hypothetical protein IPM88_21020 [Nitrospira sp.]|nr:hypothetical protein [Nitrospira sp.]